MQTKEREELPRLAGYWCSRPIKGSDTIYVNWHEPGKSSPRRRSLKTSDAGKAAEELAHIVSKERPVVESDEPTVGAIIKWYHDSYAVNLDSSPTSACKILIADLGHLTVRELGPKHPHVTAWINKQRERGLRPSTINRYLSNLRAAVNRSHEKGHTETVPPHIPALSEQEVEAQERQYDIFTPDQLRTLFAHARQEEDFFFRYLLIMAATKCRPEVAREMLPIQVDLATDLIRLNPPGRVQKKSKYRPVVKIPSVAKPYFESWMKDTPASCPFVNIGGKQISGETGRHQWNRIVKGDMGLVGRYCFRSIRPTMSSLVTLMGVDEAQISVHLGHKRPDVGKETARYINKELVYLMPTYLADTTAAINTILTVALAPRADDKVVVFPAKVVA